MSHIERCYLSYPMNTSTNKALAAAEAPIFAQIQALIQTRVLMESPALAETGAFVCSQNEQTEIQPFQQAPVPSPITFFNLSGLVTQRPCPSNPDRRFVLDTYKMPHDWTVEKKRQDSDSVFLRTLNGHIVTSIKTVPIDPSKEDEDDNEDDKEDEKEDNL